MKIGRNDPCSCGSGKKYKHCCLANELAVREEASTAVLNSGFSSDEASFARSFLGPGDDVTSPQYWEAMERRLPRKLRKELEPIINQVKAVADFEARRPAIEEAQVVLEKYRKPFERLLKNQKKVLAQAEKLFDEAPFESMWFSADDLQRAFEAVGYPPMNRNDAPFFDAARATIDFLVDVPRRHELSRQLFILVPDYVEADRPLDAWILQHNAVMLEDLPEKVCGLFLLSMFFHGMRDWGAQREREQLALFSEMGLDPDEMRRKGFEGVEEMLQEVMSNPDKTAELEAFLESHPQFKSDMQAECWTSEKAAVSLLKREDARPLLLTLEEVEPWYSAFERRLHERPELVEAVERNSVQNEEQSTEFNTILYSLGSEMAGVIFNETRLRRLIEAIHVYRRGLSPSDHEGISGVNGALMATGSDSPPTESYYLSMLCALSLVRAMEDVAKGVELPLKPILIDVRSAEEFAEGHLDGALLMPHTQIGAMIGAQVPDKNTPIILYCHSGFRAVIAKGKLKLRGYKRVQNFGGMASAQKKLGCELCR